VRARKQTEGPPLEMWGGVECAVVRIGDAYRDQLARSGHDVRPEDLDLFADLGVRALRYPILWERIAPDGLEQADWSWADERLGRLRALGIRPIVGLLHHGNGPRHTSLLDPAFPTEFARYARAVAERYPWVDIYNPINEPLTTARFTGLYGHWYPHGRDTRTFLRVLLAECRAIVLAMRAIREVNPQAQLMQSEDLGKTYSTPALAEQAAFENERRWLTFDLLCGALRPSHPMWDRLMREGDLDAADLAWFEANPCPPDILGIDHYITSERLIDDHLEHYPAATHGGNGRQTYADVEAVRASAEGVTGYRGLLAEAWERYHLPMAITEAHINSTRDEQLGWLDEAWTAARGLREAGVDVRAVTAWSLLGAYDWISLLTRVDGYYESGVFDLRGPRPRPTALATMVRQLATGQPYAHPVLAAPGWWRRGDRLWYPPVPTGAQPGPASYLTRAGGRAAQPLLIVGGRDALEESFVRLCTLRALPFHILSQDEMARATPASFAALMHAVRPWAVVYAGGYVGVDKAEGDPRACRRADVEQPAFLAAACARHGVQLLTFSSDLVFDGRRGTPYVESTSVAPLSVFGRCKAEGEARVLAAFSDALVVRMGASFGPWDRHNFVTRTLAELAAGHDVAAAADATISPVYLPDLVHTALDLLIDGEVGLWQLANAGQTTWAGLARQAAELASMDVEQVQGRSVSELGYIAPRPLYSVLGSERGALLPDLADALERYLRERQHRIAA